MSSRFEPIAVVGQSCVLPGALDPQALFDAVLAQRDLTSSADPGYWQLSRDCVWTDDPASSSDRTWSDRGGYVRGFEDLFDPDGFALEADRVRGLDPVFQWALHCGRQALRNAGMEPSLHGGGDPGVGVILGNLGYPTASHTRFADYTWLSRHEALAPHLDALGLDRPSAENVFHFGLPAHLTAAALNLRGPSFSLDAACASSIYAIKLACDRLQKGQAHTMLAGAVNHSDDLFLHVGFCALQALSRSGQSRPFSSNADGLLSAEGAAFVVLRRLRDAVERGDRILGVIRGIGLSNDGREGGFLSPAQEGQYRAMRQAYDRAELDPRTVGLLECHATGTAVGDAVEIQSSARIFEGAHDLPIGSLKSNLGHLITVAGMAGLIKVLGAFSQRVRPPMLAVDSPLADIEGSPFRLLQGAEDWEGRTRRAGLSAFGFGGNNAHLIVDGWEDGDAKTVAALSTTPNEGSKVSLAVVGVEVRTGRHPSTGGFATAWTQNAGSGLKSTNPPSDRSEDLGFGDIPLRSEGLRFPPRDLRQTLGQQLSIMELVREALERLATPLPENTSVLVGMGTDSDTCRYASRWRLRDWSRVLSRKGLGATASWLERAQEAFVPSLESAGVIGTMPNIPANRLNAQCDFKAPSFTVGSEELSGIRALELAAQSLRDGDIDAAVIGAVDLGAEVVREAAAHETTSEHTQYGDAAVVLILKRLDDAECDGETIHAVLPGEGQEGPDQEGVQEWSLSDFDLHSKVGHTHAASGLLHVAASILTLQRRLHLQGGRARPWLSESTPKARLHVEALGAQEARLDLISGPALNRSGSRLSFRVYSGQDRGDVLAALKANRETDQGPARLVFVADEVDFDQRRREAIALLESVGEAELRKNHHGIAWSSRPAEGKLGFVFNGAAAAYPGMGRELFEAIPSLSDRLMSRYPVTAMAAPWLDSTQDHLTQDPFGVLKGSALLSQAHAILSQEILGLKPNAVLGISSGETNSMFATGAWTDMKELFDEIDESGLYSREIAGEFETLKRFYGEDAKSLRWVCWRILAPIEEVQEVLSGESHVRLTMINTDRDCVIAGDEKACLRIVDALGRHRSLSLGHDIVAHCPELGTWRQGWYDVHHRETNAPDGVTYYANAFGGAYEPTRDRVADALTDQAVQAVDFRRVVESAWKDGVRVFVEHGPRGLCTGWIRDILADREHVSLALDRPGEARRQLLDTVVQLIAMGIDVDTTSLQIAFGGESHQEPTSTTLRMPARLPRVELPPFEKHSMKPAPRLPEVLPSFGLTDLTEPTTIRPSLGTVTPPQREVVAQIPAAPIQRTSVGSEDEAKRVELLESLGELHRRVAAAHRQYIDFQQQAMATLVGAHPPQTASPTTPIPMPPTPLETPPSRPSNGAPPAAKAAPNAPAPKKAEITPPPPTQEPKKEIAPAAPLTKAEPKPESYPGPKLDRKDLEHLASGKISEVLGDLFRKQDDYVRQVRMPEPPLLLADRVLGIRGEAGAMGKGTIWTESDIREDAWYLDQGHMPFGILIESGQADLLLVSWLGIDFQNRGERVYRLLGCEVTFHKGGLPKPGDTLHYDIHIDGYASQGPVQLFFFHYDCQIGDSTRLSVRHGQAGFFTDEELAGSAGVLWDAETAEWRKELPFELPEGGTSRRSFDADAVKAFTEGDLVKCFGEEYRSTQWHVRTPKIPAGRLCLFDDVDQFDPRGGPWKRGYLRARKTLANDEWFYDGHFKNDPCMPGTLMLEGCLQTVAFTMTAMGFTLDRDGWRFEPKAEETFLLRCRGQAIPGARDLVYEVFVESVEGGDLPVVTADLLVTVDGLKAFHCRGMKLQLLPDWPLSSRERITAGQEAESCANVDGHDLGLDALTACAWGVPSRAFGKMYEPFDGTRRCPRLPGPPYHFMSRVTKLDVEPNSMKPGGKIEVEYDVPVDAWYFSDNGSRSMPFCVLLEAALQPCGWLASFLGCALASDEDLSFRNLDGTGTQHVEIPPEAGVLTTRVHNTSLSKAGTMTIVGFDVSCFLGDVLVYEMDTVFGFFPGEALLAQVGLPQKDHPASAHESSGFSFDLTRRPAPYFEGELRLPGPMLSLLDRIVDYWPEGGRAGRGQIVAQMDVDPAQWFFKMHFFQDPVQPGSLGIEAMIQLLQFYVLHENLHEGLERPRFEPLCLDEAMTWRYRGQVLPTNGRVDVELEITDIEREAGSLTVVGEASLFVDGMRIYEAQRIGVRVCGSKDLSRAGEDEILDPVQDRWLADHCPTWTVPSLAAMSMVERLAHAAQVRAPGRAIVGLEDVRIRRWLDFDGSPRRLQCHARPIGAGGFDAELKVWEERRDQFESVASGRVLVDEGFELAPRAWAPLEDAEKIQDPYKAGSLFHGPTYQAAREVRMGRAGSSSILDASPGEVPLGVLNQRMLDAATHGIPHDTLHTWCDEIPRDHAAYPAAIQKARFYGRVPVSGTVRVEARFVGFQGSKRFVRIDLQIIEKDEVWAEIQLIEALIPKGRLGTVDRDSRVSFLRDLEFVEGVRLSEQDGDRTKLTFATVDEGGWSDKFLRPLFCAEAETLEALSEEIAVKEHIGHELRLHPSKVSVRRENDRVVATTDLQPLNPRIMHVERDDQGCFVRGGDSLPLDLETVRLSWDRLLGRRGWLGEDMFLGLMERFVSSVQFEDVSTLKRLRGRGALFLANHQVGVESAVFCVLSTALFELPTAIIAKQEHRSSWLGKLITGSFDVAKLEDPGLLQLVDRSDQVSMLGRFQTLLGEAHRGQRSLMVHSEGTRSLRCGDEVEVVSTTLVDTAVAAGLPIVAVRFEGGLPRVPVAKRLEFPIGYGRQIIRYGRPLEADEMKSLNSSERKQRVLEALHTLGPDWDQESPCSPIPAFGKVVRDWMDRHSSTETQAVLAQILLSLEPRSTEGQRLRQCLQDHEPLRVEKGEESLARFAREVLGLEVEGLSA